jgi:hypothetical protein
LYVIASKKVLQAKPRRRSMPLACGSASYGQRARCATGGARTASTKTENSTQRRRGS